MTDDVANLQSNIISAGGTLSSTEIDALDALIETITDAGIRSKILELTIPCGSTAESGFERLIYTGDNHTAGGGFGYAVGDYAAGQMTSDVLSNVEITYGDFFYGCFVRDGFVPIDFNILMGANGVNSNIFAYNWAGAYNKVRGSTFCLSPNLGVEQLGDTMLYDPSWTGVISVSGGTDEHFVARDGNVLMYQPNIINGGTMTTNGSGGALLLPFSGINWFAAFVGTHLTPAEVKVFSDALRTCIATMGRSEVPEPLPYRIIFIGDSRTYNTQLNAISYPNPFYARLAARLGWDHTNSEIIDYGINGRKAADYILPETAYPNSASSVKINESRPSGSRHGRLTIVWIAANDLLTGRTAAQTKAAYDALVEAETSAGGCCIVLTEPNGYLGSEGDAEGFNALLVADSSYTNGTRSVRLVRLDNHPRLQDLDDTGTFGFALPGASLTDTTIPLPINNTLADGHEVEFINLVGGGDDLASEVRYYIRDYDETSCALAATPGGAAIVFTEPVASGRLRRNRHCAISSENNTITFDLPHNFNDNDEIRFITVDAGTGLDVGTRYYASVVNSLEIGLLTEADGSVVVFEGDDPDAGCVREGWTFDGIHETDLGADIVVEAIMDQVDFDSLFAIPVIAEEALPGGQFDISYNFDADSTGEFNTYSASGLPGGLSIDPDTGVISGTPTESGTFSVVITVENDNGSDQYSTNLTISSGWPQPDPPHHYRIIMITNPFDSAGEYGQPIARKTSLEVPVVYATGTRTTLARLRLENGSSGSNVTSDIVAVTARNLSRNSHLAIKLVELDSTEDSRSVTPLFSASLVPQGKKGGTFYVRKPIMEVITDTGSTPKGASGPVKIEFLGTPRWELLPVAKDDAYTAITYSGTDVYPAL